MSKRAVPANVQAEQAVLGACLLSRIAIEAALPLLVVGDFYKPDHQVIFDAIRALAGDDATVETISVHDRLVKAGFDVRLDYLLELQNATPAISNAAKHARMIVDAAVQRRLIAAAAEISALGYGDTPTADAQEAVDRSRELLAGLDTPTGIGEPEPNVDDFIAATPSTHDWLQPQFMEYRDRMIVTGIEGSGKSTILTQIAVCVASGLHVWTLNLVEPRNVLFIDCENSHRLVNRRLTALRAKARFMDPDRLRVISRPDGLDLTTRADRAWLMDRVLANQTDLLIIGPHYQLAQGVAKAGDVGGEDMARQIARSLNEIRNRSNCAIIIEAHSPHGPTGSRELRPFGSTVWMRWPEFGIGIRKDNDNPDDYILEHWRPPRDVRIWPPVLQRGGDWPWNPWWPVGQRPTIGASVEQQQF